MVEYMPAFVRQPISEARLETAEDYVETIGRLNNNVSFESDNDIASETDHDYDYEESTSEEDESEHGSIDTLEQARHRWEDYLIQCQHWIHQMLEHISHFLQCTSLPNWLFYVGFPLLALLLGWFAMLVKKDDAFNSEKLPMTHTTDQASNVRGKMNQLQEFLANNMMSFDQESTQLTSLLDEQKDKIQSLYKLLEQRVLDDLDAWLSVMLENQKQDLSADELYELLEQSPSDRLERIEKVIASLARSKRRRAELHSSQKPNFASFENGARILHTLTTSAYSPYCALLQYLFDTPAKRPEMVLLPDDREYSPWSMKGSKGTLTIALTEPIEIQEVILAHPNVLLMVDEIQYAPKEVEVLGVEYEDKTVYSLGNFTYHVHDTRGFSIDPKMLQNKTFQIVMIKIHSNWGSRARTDVYRVRVYGNRQIGTNT